MEKVDVTIIGAGVIGLAIASEISRPDLNVFILEKNHTHGGGISSRNSEVIHGGIYYPEESLKASLCVEGNRLLYEMASKNGIPHKKTGKFIVAVEKGEIDEIERLYDNGRRSGATSLQLISKTQVVDMEPNVRAVAALSAPDSGIISVHDVMNYFLTTAVNKKAKIVCQTKVVHIEKESGHYRIFTDHGRGGNFDFLSDVVINAAGLESDTIASLMGNHYHLHYCKGNYCSISGVKPWMVQRLIYPVPEKVHTGLGVHLTLDLNGRLKLGPDTDYIERQEDYHVASEKAEAFYQHAVKFLPFLKKENVHPDMSGIRPKLQGPDDDFRDFVIKEDAPGFINLVGIESPGMTASPAIARYIRKML